MRKIIDKLRRIRHKRPKRTLSHGDLITRLLGEHKSGFSSAPVFVESGSGVSTVALAHAARSLNARVYSCDFNESKVSALKETAGDGIKEVNFIIGDSIAGLKQVAESNQRIDFAFLDSAASALHTFREFLLLEPCLAPGSVLLIDNAALPCESKVLGPVRKGKVLVPYLLASPFWDVSAFPTAGDSMICAVRHSKPDFADPAYEHPEYVDHWKALFEKELVK